MPHSPRPALLFLAHLLPFPLDGGAKIKSYYTLRALAAEYDITLLAFVRSPAEREHLPALAPFCAGGMQTVLLPRSRVRNAKDALMALLTGRSFIVTRDRVGAMQQAVDALRRAKPFAAVHIDHLQMAQYALPRRGKARLLLDHHNVESVILKRLAQTTPSPAMQWYARQEWPKLERCEMEVCRAVDHVLTVTEEDAALLRTLAPDLANATAVPIGVDLDYFRPAPPCPQSRTLLSIGTLYWPPNVDGLLWFHRYVYPLIQTQAPHVRLTLAGAKPVGSIRALAADLSVSVLGWIEDVRPLALDCAAFIVPLLSGSGMRVKILNALAMGLPVVSTTVGAEGIAATDGEDILLADTPQAFADACLRLLNDPALREELGAAGRRLVEQRYGWDATGARLLAVYHETLARP